DFEQRLSVLDCFLKKFQGVIVSLLRHLIHRAIKHALRGAFLAIPHHRTDKLFNQVIAVNRIDFLLAAADESFAWHCSFAPEFSNSITLGFLYFLNSAFEFRFCNFCYFAAPAFGRFAPYFERPCLRFSTPAASNVPRTMW